MHEFWYFGFLTAKHWGTSRNTWTSSDLASYTQVIESAAPSPQHQGQQESTLAAPSPQPTVGPSSGPRESRPQQLCNWSIHVSSADWEYTNFPTQVGQNEPVGQSIEGRLQEALQSNSFSSIAESDLPVSVKRISDIVSGSPTEVFQQGLRFAIMSRNIELVTEMVERAIDDDYDVSVVNPLHLALTFLDGSRSCCQIFRTIICHRLDLGLRTDDLGPFGFSMFDTLMVHILRNHTAVSPGILNGDFANAKNFGGEEVDSCGRWDADSREYRYLVQKGSDIPSSWKHKFCNTSIQVVCHCMRELSRVSVNFEIGSLFLRRCFTCGLKMTLPPAHLVVLTAWYVTKYGVDEEDLFGMICVLLCLASSVPPRRAKPEHLLFRKAHVDVAMFGHEPSDSLNVCAHEYLWASELARKLSTAFEARRRPVVEKGWFVFCRILEQIEAQYLWAELGIAPSGYALDQGGSDSHSDDSISDDSDSDLLYEVFYRKLQDWDGSVRQYKTTCGHLDADVGRSFGRNLMLGHLWAVCQAELLTYRRRQLGSSWTSEYVNIDIIEQFLNSKDPNTLPMVSQGSLRNYCRCGIYYGVWHFLCPRQEDACGGHFSNLNDRERSAYLDDAWFEDD